MQPRRLRPQQATALQHLKHATQQQLQQHQGHRSHHSLAIMAQAATTCSPADATHAHASSNHTGPASTSATTTSQSQRGCGRHEAEQRMQSGEGSIFQTAALRACSRPVAARRPHLALLLLIVVSTLMSARAVTPPQYFCNTTQISGLGTCSLCQAGNACNVSI